MSQQLIEKVELREYVTVGRGTTKTFQASDGMPMYVDYDRQTVTIGDYEYPFASVVKWKLARETLAVGPSSISGGDVATVRFSASAHPMNPFKAGDRVAWIGDGRPGLPGEVAETNGYVTRVLLDNGSRVSAGANKFDALPVQRVEQQKKEKGSKR